MKKHVLSALILFALACPVAVPALAQEAPPPRKMPRVPVHREALQDHKPAAPAREIQGQAIIVDGEKLRIGDLDLRLFGIVPPQLSASFGPQARAALDELTAGQNTTCMIRDRDREERFLATCHNASNADLGLELLRRGLAVAARGSIASTDFASPYIAAEQAAAAQKTGLWSMAIASAAPIPETLKADASPPAHEKTSDEKPTPATTKSEQVSVSAPSVSTTKSAAIPVITPALPLSGRTVYEVSEPGFLARYQLLITGLIMLATALGLFGAITVQRRREQRAEMQALAAALRGELMAAHAVCRTRLRSSTNADDRDIAWPRLRSTLYQAYVGRIGWLGAELARRIASIYGQASDYAAYFSNDDEMRPAALPKRQALQILMQQIDDVLPRLAGIERTGSLSNVSIMPQRPVGVVVPITAQSSNASTQAQPATRAPVETASSAAAQPAIRLWSAVQKMARSSWTKKKAVDADPIAEYTALIEEEMKRFSFVEEEEDGEQQTMDTSVDRWSSSKAHEAF